MLTLARVARELTQEELAAKADISQAKISRMENGLLEPGADTLASLAKTLDYPTSFFFQEGHNHTFPVRHYRKKSALSQKRLDAIHAQANIHVLHIRTLLKSAEFEPDLELRRMEPDDFKGGAADIARNIRSAWSLPRGPVQNVVRLMERAGAIVVMMKFGTDQLDGFAQTVSGMPPVVFVNSDAPADRLRLTLAHELGHLIMHAFATPNMELEAFAFAREFMMPEADIRPYFGKLSLPVLATLKRVWRVSMAAILEHAYRLNAITQRQYIRLRSELARNNYLKREPAELDFAREEPVLIRGIIDFHLSNLQYGWNDLATILHEVPAKARALYDPRFVASRPMQLVG